MIENRAAVLKLWVAALFFVGCIIPPAFCQASVLLSFNFFLHEKPTPEHVFVSKNEAQLGPVWVKDCHSAQRSSAHSGLSCVVFSLTKTRSGGGFSC